MGSGPPRDGGLAPWPWTVWLHGRGGVFLETREQALSTLRAYSAGSIDVGLMQVNLRWHGHRIASPEELFACFVLGTEGVRAFVGDARPTTDDRPALAYDWEAVNLVAPRALRVERSLYAADSATEVPAAGPPPRRATGRSSIP